ncbi:MAG: glycoside hydrolase family 65 protein [Saprospiraceae bacterium]|nr:glycoside hydrolase family 65 protein [Saprospiraceae bacterium]
MKNYIKIDEWKIIEEGFHPEHNRITESLCSIGNGRLGQRGMFEENYSGDTLQGSYIAGVYFPDKTRVGWWKNGYPEYFAKVLNSVNWIGINIHINGTPLDLNNCSVRSFVRELNMLDGYLYRSFIAKLATGEKVKVETKRFLSITDDECGLLEYSITAMNFSGELVLVPYLDFDVVNEDSNYDQKFWEEIEKSTAQGEATIVAKTKKLDFVVGAAMKYNLFKDGEPIKMPALPTERKKYAGNIVMIPVVEGETITIQKFVGIVSSLNYPVTLINSKAMEASFRAQQKGFHQLLNEHSEAWHKKWEEIDIKIEGDSAAQQGIRFNIFQLHQTYTGADDRLNIGPKGFTGEKYGGSTYWDTEAYCIPFYLSTADESVSRNLLIYRYKHLGKAIENAQKLGFNGGAALYPMVTMNGEECHNEWEITFEEIHRNGAIAYAIYDYINYTGDQQYLAEYGLEVLIGIARFWAQRFHFSQAKNQYVMHGVTGPNEYENNVNNNWYTSYIAKWCLNYCAEMLEWLKNEDISRYKEILKKTFFDENVELKFWKELTSNIYFPFDEERGVFLQQDGFLDKELKPANALESSERPLNQKWSWDRILRSCFIKQADVLQGIYFFEDHFDSDTIKRNFDFYEPMTVHESSLSPCVHSILAAGLGYEEKAYDMYLRTSRLDLDDYNNDACDGLHITSMAGTWMSVVKGFGGMRVKDGLLNFKPMLPAKWLSYQFKIKFRGNSLSVKIEKNRITFESFGTEDIQVRINNQLIVLGAQAAKTVSFNNVPIIQ